MERTMASSVRPLAFYLPQYHPIPENDKWWGKGFTEWRNVVKGRPLCKGHYQPHMPADLGFYDLRLPEIRKAQADMAREYGIHGFCYYHYWFNGKRLLHLPLDELLRSGTPDFPFCLCWANEDWTRAWDGLSRDVLIAQHYSEEDDLQHIRWLAKVFADPRYIRVGGKPLFMVYRARLFPDARRTTDLWREEAHKLGIGELYLCRVESFTDERDDPVALGFDAAVEFQPDWLNLDSPLRRLGMWKVLGRLGLSERVFLENYFYDYRTIVKNMLMKPDVPYRRYPCVTPAWDNAVRRENDARILLNSTPEAYEEWLNKVLEKNLPSFTEDENLVFINAWNEWAEGNHLEPCLRWGRGYLEATLRALTRAGLRP